MQRLLPPVPPTAPPLRAAAGEKAPIPELSNAVASVGCADNMAGHDGITRFLPIWVEDRGRMVPQLGFSLACLYVGCDPRNVKVDGDTVTIPREGAPAIVIPTWRQRGTDGKIIGTLMDVPMFGTRDWQTMYDYPSHKSKAAHMPIGSVWEVVETRQRLRANNHIADTAMLDFLQQLDPSAADALKAQPLDPDNTTARLAMIREKLNDAFLKPQIEAYEKLSPKEKEADPSRTAMEIVTSIWDQLPALVHQTELLQQQLAQKQNSLSREVKDKAVLVGWTATGDIDYFATAIHPQSPGAVTHGAIFNAILTNWLFTRSSRSVSFIIAALFGVFLTFVVSLTSPLRAMAAVFGFILSYLLINGEFLYDYHHHIVDMAGTVIAGLLVWSNLTAARFIAEAVEHSRIRERFRAYKDPILVNYIIEHPEISRLQSEVRLMTVGFTDLQGFTSLSETLREKAVAIVGRYMTRMVPIIRKHKGLINTFMGDGIMFSYGAPIANPNHTTDAALTVLEMQEAMKTLNAELLSEGYPELNMRAGVNTGDVIVGDAGPEDASDYTCLGDATNLAARLESANKATGTKNLIADTTAQGLNGRFLIRPIAKLRVIGKQQSILTWELMAEMSKATDPQRAIANVTQTMFDHYTAGRFAEAIAAAAEMDQLCGHSKLAALYRDRCQDYLANPPTEFEGNIVLEKK
jgi:class 3 adenylate cyclase